MCTMMDMIHPAVETCVGCHCALQVEALSGLLGEELEVRCRRANRSAGREAPSLAVLGAMCPTSGVAPARCITQANGLAHFAPRAPAATEDAASASSPTVQARQSWLQLRATTEGAFAALRTAREEMGVLRGENQVLAARAEVSRQEGWGCFKALPAAPRGRYARQQLRR